MSMTKAEIAEAVEDRLATRWKRRCLESDAAPICVIAITQAAGPNFGLPLVCTTEDMDTEVLADLMIALAGQLRRER